LAAPLQLLSLPEQLCIPVAGVALPSPQLFRYTSLRVCSRLVGVGTALIIHLGTSCQLLEKLPHTWKYVTVTDSQANIYLGMRGAEGITMLTSVAVGNLHP